MNLNLDIGPELMRDDDTPEQSAHVLNLKSVDGSKKKAAHEDVTLDMKEEIKSKRTASGRICIVGEIPMDKQGLGRVGMIAAALFLIVALNLGQVLFLGKTKGKEALATAAEAFTSLQSATQSVISGEEGADMLLFDQAEKLFADAQEKSKFLLIHKSEWLAEPAEVKSLRNLLDAGTLIAEVGQHISQAKTSFSNIPAEGSLTEYINTISTDQLEPASQKLDQINALLADVDLSSTDFETKFIDFREKVKALSAMFRMWVENKDAVLTLLGDRYPQRYMVLLMNNDEMRPGGGFIGSIILVDINDGRLTNYEFHDVYDYDGNYHDAIEMPIHELKSLTNVWRLRDSNISPDFQYSAQKASWFLEHEGGPGVDGVIGLNLSAAQAMLEETGPISVPSLSKPISAETLPTLLSALIESKYYGASSPKQILNELVKSFVEKLKDTGTDSRLASRLLLEAGKKQILAYHKFPQVADLIKQLHLDGALPKLAEVDEDFFMPVFTNIGGNKSDRYVKTQISHDTQILTDGGVLGTLTISRTHTFDTATLAWMKQITQDYGFTKWSEGLEKILGNAPNKTGIRIYLPEGAKILATEGVLRDDIQFYYDPIQEVSYYYTETSINPGESASFTVQYSLPWSFSGDFKEYNFHVYKQPGLKNIAFVKTFTAPDKTMLSSYPFPTSTSQLHDYVYQNNFESDLDIKLLYR